MTPGVKTSEFYVSLVATVLPFAAAIVVFYGLMTEEEVNLWMALIAALIPIVLQIVAGKTAQTYTTARTELKREAIGLERDAVMLESERLDRIERSEARGL